MKKLKLFLMSGAVLSALSCGGNNKPEDSVSVTPTETAQSNETLSTEGSYDPQVGLGKFNTSNVDVTKFDATMASEGEKLAEVKCISCHKPSDEKLVGPGWKGVTQRRTAPWIMNFITNPDPMIDKDPELQKQLEQCMVRMPNQSLSDQDARNILEYMRQIDGAK
ncbi:cytochrome c [Riemerella anatipestifer]|uniref:c-type cytochrome n=1 Tax=Riemerella anatipestifer TaxID=34085 RepID=UPI001BD91652|nr:cytochrome c [Riemerella anatipestifer]MBT0526054.1 cytochrome c [Riemerella anatipestifer]MBT0527921.1 cytochrome c [Riemerella anatipestifer]MBT0529961.1 cytochrome c [Riemerella anatipestifer]MBT0531819.1 cytochrome c [Riemerella anatipestifer]MBT0537591.1 cytochrome c [Riemerella anatipestifer]